MINFYALASGFLSGKYRSVEDAGKSARGTGIVQKYLNPRGLRIVQVLDEVATRLQAAASEVALAWLLRQDAVTSPIASATSLPQLQSLLRAARLQLDAEALRALDHASTP